jgi:dihydroorotate dehydrogenase/NAD-dependent dihydropyrimidine dehydrogenase PreA subunit
MIDLGVEFAGLTFKNPVSIAAHGPQVPNRNLLPGGDASWVHMNLWRKYYEAGVGSVTTGSIFFDEMEGARGATRFHLINTKGFADREGFVSAGTMPDCIWPRSQGLKAVERARREFKDMRIIASIMGMGTDPDSWAQLALEAQQAGGEAIEMNMGSVMMMETASEALKGIMEKRKLPSGAIIGLVPEVVADLIRAIKRKVSIPVIVKITPELGFYGLLSALPQYREAGVNGVVCDHTVMTVAPPDIYHHGQTTFPFFQNTGWWSSLGPWNRLVSYRDVALVGKHAPDIDVEACGGLVIPEHIIEIMMLGAKMVQLSSGIFFNGPSFGGTVLSFMKKYMEQQGYQSPRDFIGAGQKYIAEMGELQREFKAQVGHIMAKIDYDACVGPDACGECLDMFCIATYREGDVVKIDPRLCCGCNLCTTKCPHGARRLARTKKQWTNP